MRRIRRLHSTRLLPGLAALSLVALLGCNQNPAPAGGVGPPPGAAPADGGAAPAPRATLSPELSSLFRLIGQGRTDRARPRLLTYLALDPQDGKAEFLLGLTYHREKRYSLARPHFDRAVDLSPEYHPAHHFRGWCLFYLGDMEAARRSFEEHLRYVPDEGDSHFALGLIDLDADRLDDAQRRFGEAIELQAANPRRVRDVAKAHARLADVYVRRDRLEEAKSHLLTATGMYPDHYSAYFKLYRVLTRLGETEAAERALADYRISKARVRPEPGHPE